MIERQVSQDGRDGERDLIAAVVAAVRESVGPLPQLFDQPGAMKYVGLARSTWFRLRSMGEIPEPVSVPGTGPRWRRADLDAWLARLKPARRKARVVEEVAAGG